MNYMKTAIIAILIAIVTMGFASAGSTTITWCGSGSYESSWSGTGGEVTINTYTPQGYDSFHSNFEGGSSTGFQRMNSDDQCTSIYRNVDMTNAYARTHTESISGMFEDRSYTSRFEQRSIFTPRNVSVYDW